MYKPFGLILALFLLVVVVAERAKVEVIQKPDGGVKILNPLHPTRGFGSLNYRQPSSVTQDERAEPDLVKGVSLNAYEDSSSHGHQEGCEAGHHESNEGHKESHNIFMMGSQLSPLLVSIFMVVTIMITVGIESLTHHMESKADEFTLRLIQQVYKELMLMGLISFTLFLVESFVPIKKADLLLSFEYAHVLMFMMAVIYVVQAALLIASVSSIYRKMERINSDPNMANSSYWSFRLFRNSFIQTHDLPTGFLFDRYMYFLHRNFVKESLHISVRSWCGLIFVFLLDMVLSIYYSGPVQKWLFGEWEFCAYGWGIFLINVFLWWTVRDAHSRLTKNLKVETTKVDPRKTKKKPLVYDSQALRAKRASLSLDDQYFEPKYSQQDQKYNFMLRFPRGFRYFQDLLALVNCLYLACFVTTYITEIYRNGGSFWILILVLTPIPSLLCMFLVNPFMVVRYLLVKSATQLDVHSLDQVVGYMETVELVFERIAERMRECKDNMGEDFLFQTFQVFDADGNGTIDYNEFKLGLRSWGLKVTNRELHALLRFVDADYSGQIDIKEFKSLLLGKSIFKGPGDDFSELQDALALSIAKTPQLSQSMRFNFGKSQNLGKSQKSFKSQKSMDSSRGPAPFDESLTPMSIDDDDFAE